MAGRNQHHIPQFLQRGFGIPTKGRAKNVWLFERSQEPRISLIKETAAGFDFYSPPALDAEETLDDRITDLETPLSRKVAKLRSLPIGSTVDPEIASEVVNHFAPRTAFFREFFGDAIQTLLNEAMGAFTDPERVIGLLGLDADGPEGRFREKIGSSLSDLPQIAQTGLPGPVIEQVAFWYAKENFAQFFEAQLPQITAHLEALLQSTEALTRDGHNKALDKGLLGGLRRDDLAAFSWRIEAAPVAGAILPDCVALGIEEGAPASSLLGTDRDKLVQVVMPLDSGRLLIGFKSDQSASFDPFTFNRIAATCSHRFFLATHDSEEFKSLTANIGQRSATILDEALEDAREMLRPASRMSADNQSERIEVEAERTGATTESEAPVRPLDFQVSFFGCADEPTARQIADSVFAVAMHLQPRMPLDRLDGVTFAADYPEALRSLDRGIPGMPPAPTVSEEVGTGFAQAVTIQRNNLIKSRVVLASWVGHNLVGDDEDARRWAIYILVSQLATAAFTQLEDEAFPGELLQPASDKLDGWLYGNVSAALDSYVTSEVAAAYGDAAQVTPLYRERFIAALDRAREKIPPAKLDYRTHSDIDKLFAIVDPLVHELLSSAAMLLGQVDGADVDLNDREGALDRALSVIGLKAWLTTYQADLRTFREQVGGWKTRDDFVRFNRHVERILWQFGIFPWRKPDRTCRIEIPMTLEELALLTSS